MHLHRFGLLGLVVALLASAQLVAGAPAALAEESGTGATVRVMVELDVETVPEAELSGAAATRQRDRIDAAVAAVVADLPDGVVVDPLETVASVMIEATPDALDVLAESDLVVDVVPERLARPLLDSSLPVIGADLTVASGWDGTGSTVAVLDSGVDSGHQFFDDGSGGSRVVAQACFSSGGDCPNGETFDDGPGAGEPCTFDADCDHGTHVAGIAAGAQDPANTGPTGGVAPGAGVVAVQVFSDNGGLSASSFDLADALEWTLLNATALDIAAVNLSLGGARTFEGDCDFYDPTLADLMASLAAAGVPTVVASGNEYEANGMSWPACLSPAIAVGAVTDGGEVTSFSNSSVTTDLLAPGASITSSTPDDRFETKSGTSMAAPHVAGAWAALREARDAAGLAPDVAAELDAFRASATSVDDVVVSDMRLVDLPAALAPGGPSEVVVTAAGDAATVVWGEPAWLGGGPVTSYEVLSWPAADPAAITISGAGAATTLRITGLGDATGYGYGVQAVNDFGTGTPVDAAMITVPDPPTEVWAVGGNAKATVTWTVPAADGGAAVTDYRVTVAPTTGVTGDAARLVGGTAATLVFTGLDNGATYTFTVTALNEAGESAASDPSNEVSPRSSGGGGGGGGGGSRSGSTTTTTRPRTSTTSSTTLPPDDDRVAHPTSPGAAVGGGRVVTVRDGKAVVVSNGAPAGTDVVGGAITPSGKGAWSVTADGRVFTSGDAPALGSVEGTRINAPIVGIAPTPTGRGYWLLGEDGGIFSFGDARFFGSTGGMRLNRPVVGMASTSSGNGYWLFAGDGGIFTFGDARFLGSTGGLRLNAPVTTMAATPTGRGYWLLGADGGVFTFGDATFAGSTGGDPAVGEIEAIVSTGSGRGYWLIGHDGRLHPFGDAA